MAKPFTLDFVLEPAGRDRLANLCGPEDENLKYIEKYLKVSIAYSGEHFQVVGPEKMARTAQKIICQLYLETAPVGRQKKAPWLTLEKVHLTLLESRVLMQDAEADRMLEKYQDSAGSAAGANAGAYSQSRAADPQGRSAKEMNAGQDRSSVSFPPVWGSTDSLNSGRGINSSSFNDGRSFNGSINSSRGLNDGTPKRFEGTASAESLKLQAEPANAHAGKGSHGAVTAADELFSQMDGALHLEDSPYFADAERYSYADEEAAKIAAEYSGRQDGSSDGILEVGRGGNFEGSRGHASGLDGSRGLGLDAGQDLGLAGSYAGNHGRFDSQKGNNGKSDYYASIFKDSSFVPRSTADTEAEAQAEVDAETWLDKKQSQAGHLDNLDGLDDLDSLDELETSRASILKLAKLNQTNLKQAQAQADQPTKGFTDLKGLRGDELSAESAESVESVESTASADNGGTNKANQNRQQFKEQRKMTDWREMRDLTEVNAGDYKAQDNVDLDRELGGRSRGNAGSIGHGQTASHGAQGGEINRMYNKASTLKLKHGVIKPRTANQSAYIASVDTHDVNFGIGPAGTGKTYLAVAAAVDALERNEVRRIILTRPAVEAGEKLGFLPGDLSQKVDPYLRPLYDALFEMLGFEKVEKLIERQIIEIAPLAYMRGRTLNDSFIILDEAQNTTIEQMKMFLTRIGFNSKAVITGDPSQIDLPRNVKSGLKHALEVLQGIESISFTFFETVDVVRHPVVAAIVNAYALWDKKQEELKAQRLREGIESRMSGEGAPHHNSSPEGRGGFGRGYAQRFSQRAGGSAEFIPAEAAVGAGAAEAGAEAGAAGDAAGSAADRSAGDVSAAAGQASAAEHD